MIRENCYFRWFCWIPTCMVTAGFSAVSTGSMRIRRTGAWKNWTREKCLPWHFFTCRPQNLRKLMRKWNWAITAWFMNMAVSEKRTSTSEYRINRHIFSKKRWITAGWNGYSVDTITWIHYPWYIRASAWPTECPLIIWDIPALRSNISSVEPRWSRGRQTGT